MTPGLIFLLLIFLIVARVVFKLMRTSTPPGNNPYTYRQTDSTPMSSTTDDYWQRQQLATAAGVGTEIAAEATHAPPVISDAQPATGIGQSIGDSIAATTADYQSASDIGSSIGDSTGSSATDFSSSDSSSSSDSGSSSSDSGSSSSSD